MCVLLPQAGVAAAAVASSSTFWLVASRSGEVTKSPLQQSGVQTTEPEQGTVPPAFRDSN